jgi:DNA repair photolyase
MLAISRPGGRAFEYASLGLNIYSDCSHRCKYCYNKNSSNGSSNVLNQKASLHNIEADLRQLASKGNRQRVHLSFVGDIYDAGRQNNDYTREVLQLFRNYDHPFQVLTKGGSRAFLDFDLYRKEDRFGVTLTYDNDADSQKCEPGAALPDDRIESLKVAHKLGIETWVSLEPVIDPAQTLNLIDLSHEFVDFFWVGKLNHRPKIEQCIDWRKFRADAETRLRQYNKDYKIKADLAKWS